MSSEGRTYVEQLTVKLGGNESNLTVGSDGATLDTNLKVLGFQGATRSSAITTAMGDDFVVFMDTTLGDLDYNLDAIATVGDRTVVVKNTGVNVATINRSGADTIEGATSYDLLGLGDTVWLVPNGTDWQVIAIFGGSTVQADQTETLVLDHSADEFATAANLAAGEVIAAAQAASVDARGRKTLKVTVEITTLGNITSLSVGCRAAGDATAAVATPADWGYVRTDSIDRVTGISLTNNYLTTVDTPVVGKYDFKFDIDARRLASVVVFADDGTGGSRGNVYVQRGT